LTWKGRELATIPAGRPCASNNGNVDTLLDGDFGFGERREQYVASSDGGADAFDGVPVPSLSKRCHGYPFYDVKQPGGSFRLTLLIYDIEFSKFGDYISFGDGNSGATRVCLAKT
jgi:hypothetical protein